jgi:rhodanese-related sulfurtransferase
MAHHWGIALVANRVLAPRSKLATHRWLDRVARPDGGRRDLEYSHRLRGMDALAEVQPQVEEAVYWQLMNLLRCDPTLVFVDLTAIYAEGEGVEPLWQYGHSKDGKSQNKQLRLVLAVTPDGYRLAHFLFEGNRAGKVAMLEMLQQLRHHFGLKRWVVVGDRGLISAAVLRALDQAGYDHILALRARQSKTATAALEQEVSSRWTEVDEHLWVQEVKVPEAPRVVLAFNPRSSSGTAAGGSASWSRAGMPWTVCWTAGSQGASPPTRWRSGTPPEPWCKWRRTASSMSRCAARRSA